MKYIEWADFEMIDMRIGTVIHAEPATGVLKPAYRMRIDFGELGVKNSSAQITKRYQVDELIGKQVVAVVNFKPKQIGKYISECLVLGVASESGDIILLIPERKVLNGLKIC
jgi:tRNA-binding protein